jgi:hypothetical protein
MIALSLVPNAINIVGFVFLFMKSYCDSDRINSEPQSIWPF